MAAASFGLRAEGQTDAPPPVLQQRVPTIKVNSRLVVLDVVVTGKHGEPITGLRKRDFHLSDDDVPQVLTGFTENAPTMQPVLQRQLPANTFTNLPPMLNTDASTIILMDATQTDPTWRSMLRKEIVAYVKEAPENSSMAVFQLDTDLRMVHGITTDRQALIDAVENYKTNSMVDPMRRAALIPELRGSVATIGQKEALADISRYAAGFPGRKNLVWFCGDGGRGPTVDRGSLAVALPELRGLSAAEEGKVSEVLTLNRISIYPVLSKVIDKSGSGGFGFITPGPTPYHESIPWDHRFPNEPELRPVERVARDTGGMIFYGTPKDALETISNAGAHYYTLSFSPTRFHGEAIHALNVTVDRPEVRLEYRVNYRTKNKGVENVAPVAPTATAPRMVAASAPISVDRKLDVAMDLSRIDATEILFDATVTPAAEIVKDHGASGAGNYMSSRTRGKGYRNYEIKFAPQVGTLHLNQDPDGHFRGVVDYVAAVYDDDEKMVDGVIKRAPMDFSLATYEQALRYGLIVSQTIAVPAKGHYFLRLGVRDIEGNSIGTLQVPVSTIALP